MCLRTHVQKLDSVPMSPNFKVPKSDTRICVVSDTPYPSPSNIAYEAVAK